MKYSNHLSLGADIYFHKNKSVATTLNSFKFELFTKNLEDYDYDVGVIPAGYEHRADLISNLFYNTPTFDWFICLANDVYDPFQQLNIGDLIKIPKII
jgi:hypothetical protein